MSLGQVAQGDISRTAIYFVETGKARPSMETLQLIAARTNKPLEYFLGDAASGDEAGLAEVERLVAVGENAAAVDAAESLVARSTDRRTAAHVRVLMCTALVRLSQGVRARSQASAARAYFEQAGDVLMAAESLGWEAAAARVMDDPVSVDLATEALRRCRSLDPVPPTTEARLLAMLGHVLVARHEYQRAIDAYEEAIAVGANFADLRRLSYVYGNLSLAYQELGHLGQAGHYARKAMAIDETLQDRVLIAFGENNLALLIFKQGDLASAVRHAERSLRQLEQIGVEAGRANVLMTLSELELERSGYEAAAAYARTAVELAERLGENTNAGEAHMWLGRIAAAQDDDSAADAEFAIAFDRFDQTRAADWQARGHALYAEILEARGDLAGANRQLRRALAAAGRPSTYLEAARIAIA